MLDIVDNNNNNNNNNNEDTYNASLSEETSPPLPEDSPLPKKEPLEMLAKAGRILKKVCYSSLSLSLSLCVCVCVCM